MLEPPFISADILLKSLAKVTFFSSFESEEICRVNVLVGADDEPGLSLKVVSLRLPSEP